MRDDLEAAELAAIAALDVVAFDLVWVTAKNRGTSAPEPLGFWSGAGDLNINVKDGITGSTVSRLFYGSGQLLSIDAVPLVSNLTIRTVNIVLSQLSPQVEALVRTSEPRGAPVQIYRSFHHVSTRALLAAAKPRFLGFVDGAPIETPREGGEGSVTLNCVSSTRELTRISAEVRSNASQRARSATDNFYADTQVVGDWDIWWGSRGGPLTTTNQKK